MNKKVLFGVEVPLWGREAFILRNTKMDIFIGTNIINLKKQVLYMKIFLLNTHST